MADTDLHAALIHTVITTLIPHPTFTSLSTTAISVSSLPSPSTSSQNGIISPNPHRFPTTLAAILLTLFSLAILIVLLIYLRRRGYSPKIPSIFPASEKGNNYVWSAYGLVRASSLERSKKRHRLRDLRKAEEEEDPIAVAIRKEEQERRKREMEERGGGSRFYAPQVRHLVQLMGSKEEIRIDVKNKVVGAKSWRWGRGKGMGENEVQSNSTPSAGV
jgi:hypothetical protein